MTVGRIGLQVTCLPNGRAGLLRVRARVARAQPPWQAVAVPERWTTKRIGTASGLVLGATLLFGAAPAPAAARAAAASSDEIVKVVSVDGPLDLTLKPGKGKAFRARLADLDAPRAANGETPAECGADVAISVLRDHAPVGSRLRLTAKSKGGVDGRTLVAAWSHDRGESRRSSRSINLTMLRTGVAKSGAAWALSAAGVPKGLRSLGDGYDGPDDGVSPEELDSARARFAIWGRCGGRFHAPLGVPPNAPTPTWEIDGDNLLRRVGPIGLSSALSPSGMTRFRDLAAADPELELTRYPSGLCVATSAAAGAVFQGVIGDDGYALDVDRRPCAEQLVGYVDSLGPVAPTRGPAVGAPIAGLKVFGVKPPTGRNIVDGVALVKGNAVPWAWQTNVSTLRRTVSGYSAFIVVNYA